MGNNINIIIINKNKSDIIIFQYNNKDKNIYEYPLKNHYKYLRNVLNYNLDTKNHLYNFNRKLSIFINEDKIMTSLEKYRMKYIK